MKNWAIIGHEWAVQQMQHALTSGNIPHALLITGPESVGKSTLARTFVKALFYQAGNNQRPC